MIFDSIRNKDNYREDPEIYQALCHLEQIREWEEALPDTVIHEGVSFANPVFFVSKEENECAYEAHKQYIDLHYIMEGAERIATADVRDLQIKTPFSEEKDIGFYTGPESGRYLLKPGDFMVCYPSDAHKVAMMEKEPETVKKIVVKIKANPSRG
ncbi:MAG: DUF386 domain-containing protein [Lachnospiraceae bacterium]|nr:DUF386 domain-containing protein [Lachnospiraceae bacterium]